MDDEPGLSHNSALKLGLRHLLYRSAVGPEWVFTADATDVLRTLWREVAQSVDEPDRRPPDGLEVSSTREVEGYLVRVISFPRPEEVAENHFAAVAYRPARRGRFPWNRGPASLRYVALEYGHSSPGEQHRTVLGEWTADCHLNYGDGPEPTVDGFLDALRPILAQRLRPIARYIPPRPDV